MRDSFSWLTPKQAGELAGYSARHIQNLITGGKLSASKDDGKYYIDKAEFFRVFPKALKEEQNRNSQNAESERDRLEMENRMLKDIQDKRDKEIEFLRNQIEFVSQEKVKMLDVIVSNTKLLEYKQDGQNGTVLTKRRGWKELFKIK